MLLLITSLLLLLRNSTLSHRRDARGWGVHHPRLHRIRGLLQHRIREDTLSAGRIHSPALRPTLLPLNSALLAAVVLRPRDIQRGVMIPLVMLLLLLLHAAVIGLSLPLLRANLLLLLLLMSTLLLHTLLGRLLPRVIVHRWFVHDVAAHACCLCAVYESCVVLQGQVLRKLMDQF